MKKRYIGFGLSTVLLLGLSYGLLACSQPPAEPTPVSIQTAAVTSPRSTTPSVGPARTYATTTPGIGGPGVITGTTTATTTLAATPVTKTPSVALTPSAISTLSAIATPSPTATSSPTAVVSTPTPTAPKVTPTPAPNRETLSAARTLEDEVGTYLDAIDSNDLQGMLRAQKDLLDNLDKADATLKADNSKVGEQVRAAAQAIREGIAGDRGKLQDAQTKLREVLGLGPANSQTTTPHASASDLQQIATDLANTADSFRRAVQQGNASDSLRLQKDLLDQLAKIDGAVQNVHTPEADQLRSAAEDIRNALAGDTPKLDSALAKLRQSTTPTPTASPTKGSSSSVDIQPIARSLDDKLSRYTTAQQQGNQDEASRLQQEIEQDAAKAQDSIRSDQSPQAQQLRNALQALKEAFGGDQAKFEIARNQLQAALGS